VIHVLAGPGTGKTFSMMRRIQRWLEAGVAPQRILAVTFTRTAARDLKDQLARMAIPGAEGVRASTLHSLAYSVLVQDEVFEATGRSPRALFSYEVRQLILDLRERHGGIRRVKSLLRAFEAGWARLQRDPIVPPADAGEAALQADLLDWLRYHRAILIGELVPLALAYARRNPASTVLPSFDHIVVDEYQDLNRADQTLVVAIPRTGS
jgi:superfamily I DNA/RNA helicase